MVWLRLSVAKSVWKTLENVSSAERM